MTTPTRSLLALLGMCLAIAACRPDPSTPRGTAERFLDAHFVAIDLRDAATYTSGLARDKVEKEIALTAGQVIDDSTHKPTVRYELVEERPDGEHSASYLYLGTIALDGGERFERRWLVTVRREAEGWRVTNFQEFAD